jgi:hypothetical protein
MRDFAGRESRVRLEEGEKCEGLSR